MSEYGLFIVSAPSGAGKTSMLSQARQQLPDLRVAVSHTTREARAGEIDGQHYHFIAKHEFDQMQAAGDFVEHAEVFGNHYGTSRQSIDALLQAGLQVVLEIDWQGARQIRSIYPHAKSIFILPPSLAILEQRLIARDQDSQAVIAARMNEAMDEMKHYADYDYLIINDDLQRALHDLITIFESPDRYIQPDRDKLSSILAG